MTFNQQEKLFKQFLSMTNTHRGEISSAYFDYQVYRLYHPRYEQEYDQIVPVVVLDFIY